MGERHRDPLELWVGTWTPEEWVERETRRAEERRKTEERLRPEERPTLGPAQP
ncbi:MAG: hypothetical protein QN141_08140 [Armatimonadota bacterium]|nr:hypothetical protein [Armatimonadota bacterium]MDR7451150.1 hypothetical protein [Armatimonadota bacterium]MDR7467245.1 hypothetical protein [Armatimonadota bacterium]MDR7494827.1 hypothetical protein [Armatimonadota bacterium]MDR7504527.1 hypothetical protein [Armatimonadota bacterium]